MDKRKELQDKIIEKAMKDEQFKKQLMENPKETLKKEFDIELPESVEVKVSEEKQEEYHLVIPSVPEEEASSNFVW